ncbi:hypothetical protein SM963_11455, partial [Escherichia coli]|nr:hypothetical protein [Escherichia coli]
GTADRNRSHWSTSKTPSYTKSVSWQHHPRLNANKFPVVIDWLSKGLIKPEKLITHTFDFQHVADAISLFEQDQKHCCKVLLTFSE